MKFIQQRVIEAGLDESQVARLEQVAEENPQYANSGSMNVFSAQAICATLPRDPTKVEILHFMRMVSEPEALNAIDAGRFDDMAKTPVPKGTTEIVIPPAVCYFIDGKVRRAVQMAASWATFTSIKLARLQGDDPKLLLASPERDLELTTEEALDGLHRLMRLEVGNACELPSATNIGPMWTDPDIIARVAGA